MTCKAASIALPSGECAVGSVATAGAPRSKSPIVSTNARFGAFTPTAAQSAIRGMSAVFWSEHHD